MSDDGLQVQSGSRRRRIVGTFNPGVLVFAACCALILFAIAWLGVASPTNDASDMVKALPPICIVLTVETLIATSRIVVDPAGFIDVIGPLAIQRVPTVDLVAVEHDNGLQLRLTSGRRIESFAAPAIPGATRRIVLPVTVRRRQSGHSAAALTPLSGLAQ